MTSRLASLLVQDGLVGAKKMAEAFQRQVIYGGTLDTILLEMDVIDEGTLLDALGRSSALPIAGDLPSLEQLQAADVQKWMPAAMSERFRAVPVALDGSSLRVLVIDPPDRKQLDELGYTLSLTIDPIIVPEHRFVQAVELVYGVAVPARFASLAGKLRARATDPTRAKLTPSQPSLPAQPARERSILPEPNAPAPVGERIKEGTPTEPQKVAPLHVRVVAAGSRRDDAQGGHRRADAERHAVGGAGNEGGRAASGRGAQPAPSVERTEELTPRLTTRQAGAPVTPMTPPPPHAPQPPAPARSEAPAASAPPQTAVPATGGVVRAAVRRRGARGHRGSDRSRRHLRGAVPRHARAAAVRRDPDGARRHRRRQAGARADAGSIGRRSPASRWRSTSRRRSARRRSDARRISGGSATTPTPRRRWRSWRASRRCRRC